tara:strand:+ start:167 stop:406 length:240 start_codon:yes stop_codon:yes gene_type:complete
MVAIPIIAACVSGTVFYNMMERSIPTESNCSYLATPVTDLLAFLWGALICYYGFKYKNNILIYLGATIIVEHIYQVKRK